MLLFYSPIANLIIGHKSQVVPFSLLMITYVECGRNRIYIGRDLVTFSDVHCKYPFVSSASLTIRRVLHLEKNSTY